MTTPFLSIIGAALYFGWLWHNRTASSRAEAGSLDLTNQEPKRIDEMPRLRLAPVAGVTAKPFSRRPVSIAHGTAQ